MEEENNSGTLPADVLERLEGYAERMDIKVGEAANKFKEWLKNEYSVDNLFDEDPFYLSQWSEQFVIETRNLGGARSSGRETETYVGMLVGIEDSERDNRQSVMEKALNVFRSNSDRAISEGLIGVLTAKEGVWHINGKASSERVDGSNLPWFGFEHGDMILCLLNTRSGERKPMAPTSVSRTAYFLGSPEKSNTIQLWRLSLSGKAMDADYEKWTACKIQVIPPSQEGRNTLYTNRDFHEKIEYTDTWLPEHLRKEFTPERLLVNENIHGEFADLGELVEIHSERKVTTATGTTVNPIVITKGYVSLLNKEPMNSEYDQTGRSYRMNITSLGLQSRNGRDSSASSVTIWIPGRMHDEEHPFDFKNKDDEWQGYAERTQVIVVGRLRLRPYNDEMQPSLGAVGIYVPSRTARPAGGSGSTSTGQFGGDGQ